MFDNNEEEEKRVSTSGGKFDPSDENLVDLYFRNLSYNITCNSIFRMSRKILNKEIANTSNLYIYF